MIISVINTIFRLRFWTCILVRFTLTGSALLAAVRVDSDSESILCIMDSAHNFASTNQNTGLEKKYFTTSFTDDKEINYYF